MLNIKEILKNIDLGVFKKLENVPEEFREEMRKMTVIGESAGGLVEIGANGEGKIRTIKIDKSLVPDENVCQTLVDLLIAAFNVTQEKVQKKMEEIKDKKLISLLPELMNPKKE